MENYEIIYSIIIFYSIVFGINLINFNKIKKIYNISSLVLICTWKIIKYKILNIYNKVYNKIYNKYFNYIIYDKINNIIKIEYNINYKKYIFCQEIGKLKTTRILNCIYKNIDKTEELMLYLGPNKDFHGQKTFSPKFMGYDELEINYFTEDFEIETKLYKKDDIILL